MCGCNHCHCLLQRPYQGLLVENVGGMCLVVDPPADDGGPVQVDGAGGVVAPVHGDDRSVARHVIPPQLRQEYTVLGLPGGGLAESDTVFTNSDCSAIYPPDSAALTQTKTAVWGNYTRIQHTTTFSGTGRSYQWILL